MTELALSHAVTSPQTCQLMSHIGGEHVVGHQSVLCVILK